MKNIILTGILILSSLISSAQEFNSDGFSIKEVGSKFSMAEIESVIKDANWCTLRYMNKRQVLNFKSGAIVELHSISEMKSNSVVVDEACHLIHTIEINDEFLILDESRKIVRLRSKKGKK